MTQRSDTTPSSTAWTVTGRPRRFKPESIALAAGAASNLLALVTFAAIGLGGPIWLVVASIIATALTAVVASRSIRAIPRERLSHSRTWSQHRSATSTGSEFG